MPGILRVRSSRLPEKEDDRRDSPRDRHGGCLRPHSEGARRLSRALRLEGMVLSFPADNQRQGTKVDTCTRNLFIDVTSTEERIGGEALAIVCSHSLTPAGRVESVRVDYQTAHESHPTLPQQKSSSTGPRSEGDGLELAASEMKECLARSRLGLNSRAAPLSPVTGSTSSILWTWLRR